MAANVESMFYTRETPWHGLGTRVEEAPSSSEALQLAGLDWMVTQEPIYTETKEVISGYRANVRSSDRKVLGVVTDRYKIVQNHEAFAFTDALLGEGVRYETAGALQEGKRVWLLARLPREYIISGERISPYLVFSNTHDGSGAVKVALTPVRVVCNNTLNLALDTAKRSWSMIHTGNIKDKIQEAENTLFMAEEYMDSLGKEFERLRRQKITDQQVKEYIEQLLPIEKDVTAAQAKNITKLRKDMQGRYYDIKLRNIVLMADTETEFIQMLGRKRDDGKKLKLYIYRYDKEHFERRLSRIDQILEIAISYLKYLNSCKRAYERKYKEELVIQNRHIKLMREIFDNKISMMYARNLFNVYGGVFYLNLLSYQNLINLKAYYQNVIASFDAEEDDAKREDCFVKMQLGWLGIEEKKAEDIIKKSKVTKFDKCYNKVIDAFEGMRNIPMNEKEAKNFQINIRDEIIVLIDSIKDDMKDDEKFKTARAQGGKSKCALSRPTVEFLNKHCGIPYQMTVESTADGKRYTIRKEDWETDA